MNASASTALWQRPAAQLSRIGILRLRLLLPRYREQLKDARKWEDLSEAYALSVLFREELWKRPDTDAPLVAEYEGLCRDILADVAKYCAEQAATVSGHETP